MPQAAPRDRAFARAANCEAAPISTAEFRDALSRLTTAVSVIATDGPAGVAGLTCSAVCAVSDEPPMLLACVHGKSAANAVIKANGVLCVNCLQSTQRDLSQAFAGFGAIPMPKRFALGDWGVLATGAPRSRDALVALDCEVVDVRDIGTHSIFIARVVATAAASDGAPLVYQRRAYATTQPL
jgi:flavin reductase (NADH)/flavin reductase/chlorophenol-4-monooxygenase component 1